MSIHLRPLSRAEVRELDVRARAELALPTLILMENAGRGAAGRFAELTGFLPPNAGGRPFLTPAAGQADERPRGPDLPKVLVLCGPGNNGGDGAVVARHLNAWGFPVRALWLARSDQIRGDAASQWAILEKSGIAQHAWFDDQPKGAALDSDRLAAIVSEAEWLVDGLLGTGLSRPVEGPLRAVIELLNHSGKPIFALDLPSGLDADSGEPLGVAISAVATATFVASKRGFENPSAADFTGHVTVVDIGLPRCLLEPYIIAPR